MTQQPFVTLNDGVRIPQLGLGVWQVDDSEVVEPVMVALEAGYRHIDTAKAYGNERGVGEAVRRSGLARDEVFVTTKVWNGDQGYQTTLDAFEGSMERLGFEVLDLLLIHWAKPSLDKYVETFQAMIELKNAGRVRSIGVSNFHDHHLDRLIAETGVVPSVNQVELHPRFQQKKLRAYHREKGIATESWSPLGQGRLIDDPALGAIGEKYGKSGAQVMIRWHLQEGMIVIPKSVTPSRIRDNFNVFDFELDAEDLAKIEAMDSPDGRNGADPDHVTF